MAVFAKFFITNAYSSSYVWTAELFPTFIRLVILVKVKIKTSCKKFLHVFFPPVFVLSHTKLLLCDFTIRSMALSFGSVATIVGSICASYVIWLVSIMSFYFDEILTCKLVQFDTNIVFLKNAFVFSYIMNNSLTELIRFVQFEISLVLFSFHVFWPLSMHIRILWCIVFRLCSCTGRQLF